MKSDAALDQISLQNVNTSTGIVPDQNQIYHLQQVNINNTQTNNRNWRIMGLTLVDILALTTGIAGLGTGIAGLISAANCKSQIAGLSAESAEKDLAIERLTKMIENLSLTKNLTTIDTNDFNQLLFSQRLSALEQRVTNVENIEANLNTLQRNSSQNQQQLLDWKYTTNSRLDNTEERLHNFNQSLLNERLSTIEQKATNIEERTYNLEWPTPYTMIRDLYRAYLQRDPEANLENTPWGTTLINDGFSAVERGICSSQEAQACRSRVGLRKYFGGP